MAPKSQRATFESISSDAAGAIILATTGTLNKKQVDPRRQIAAIHIKKYVAIERINHRYESWIALINRINAQPEGSDLALTEEETLLYEECKKETSEYLLTASDALKANVEKSSANAALKSISSSMKYKFSQYSFEVITYVINLMVRELLVYICDQCLSKNSKLTKAAHIPWDTLQTKLFSALYSNTQLFKDAVNRSGQLVEEVVEQAATETVDETAVESEETTADDAGKPEEKKVRHKLTQYITNIFKEIKSREARFSGLLLGKEITAVINDLIYQVLDRYVNIIKSLLLIGNGSKTITAQLAEIATSIIFQESLTTSNEDVQVVLDLVHERVEQLMSKPEETDDQAEEEQSGDAEVVEETVAQEATAEVAVVEQPASKKGKKKTSA